MYVFFVKRFFDLLVSFIVLIALFPFLLPIVILLILTGENYVFYLQERIGFRNKPFMIYKFATMLKNSPNIGTGLHTASNDPRILPMGHFLRNTKINELPQLLNIFFGSMSFVGPRPLAQKTFEPYSKFVKDHIYNVKPGLSGIGSIVFRNEEQILSNSTLPLDEFYSKFISPYKGSLELWYQKKISFYTDFMIIFLTIWVVFFPKSNLVFRVFKDLPEKPNFLDH